MRQDRNENRDTEFEITIGPDDPPMPMMVGSETDADEEAEGQIRSGKLAGKSLPAAIWILAVPVLLQQTMQACVGLFDKIFAGGLQASGRARVRVTKIATSTSLP